MKDSELKQRMTLVRKAVSMIEREHFKHNS